ncbi:Lipoprotein-releasing system, ATP-binding protein LolD [Nitrospina gracilis 3/211]|uniref:Lipoprotein-releasing system, ATP-binding protein LolD n=1 Tax=Nitrospina gracilis (strain 3/211) TaxID=1266370 RepID=M1Z2I8_NITG3|nr:MULTISPECIES: ABC transporter ATP-binding protein [Nitrospina]MCF8722079.1 lipoprotein-releasing system ATP-binding protein [Nitrospina sp. Nb-3]CCQ92211.1 Lipoprotein-releasing system, ATP-binding protein LolD [Nitrospina gracilis 3/211]
MNDSRGDILLNVTGVWKAYRRNSESVEVLKDADLQVKTGEILGIVGASGAGKSTLLHIMGGLDRPQKGKVEFRGQDIFAQKNGFLEQFRNRHIGFVFQLFNLLPDFTALENTLFPGLISGQEEAELRDRAVGLLTQMGLKDRLHHKPGELSGGETQRVALARSLVNQPDLLLADEPTGNLDSKSSDAFMDLVRDLNKKSNQTFVIVTHSPRIAKSLDRVLQLVDGEIKPIDKELIL